MKKVMVIGATGQLAADIIELFKSKYEIIPIKHSEMHIENNNEVSGVIGKYKPDIVINTAAFHNVAQCEENPQKAFLINATALKYLSEACNEIDATLVHFSTDYVFGKDENRTQPYTEDDLPGPVQVYGISKLAGEKVLDAYCNKYYCLRVSGLYGIKGTSAKKYPNFVEMMLTLGKKAEEKKERFPSAKDQVLTFNYTLEIAKVVMQLLETQKYGLYHATCEGYTSRVEFVKELFDLTNINVDVYEVDSSYFKPKYKQPKFSVLENAKLKKLGIQMPHWKDALKEYLKIREQK